MWSWPDGVSDSEAYAPGVAALREGRWAAAAAIFEGAVGLCDPALLEGLGCALYWLHTDLERLFAVRQRAFELYRERGQAADAARIALLSGSDSVNFRGELAVGQGWVQRARRLLDELPTCAENGWCELLEGWIALRAENDPAKGARLSRLARHTGREVRDSELEVMGRAFEGLSLVTLGDRAGGMRALDEAVAAALGGELEDRDIIGTICCAMVSACSLVRDYDRAGQWCERTLEAMERMGVPEIGMLCRPNFAVVLQWRGKWERAEAELVVAKETLTEWAQSHAGEAIVRLAELRCRQGRLDEADELFGEVEGDPFSFAGLAELAYERGDLAGALELAQRAARRVPPEMRGERASALELLVRFGLEADQREVAEDALAELREAAETLATAPMVAAVAYSEGLIALHRGATEEARNRLEEAVERFAKAGSHFETARARLALARALAGLGSTKAALMEAGRAREVFMRLGARCEAGRATAALEGIAGGPAQASAVGDGVLSARELEVLQLVAGGRSNQQIADELVISVRTVERHLSNVYIKLDVSGPSARAAATAYVLTRGR